MQIDLSLLKFHFFKYNKTIHNLANKNHKEFFEKLFFDKSEKCLSKTLKTIYEININDFHKKFKNYHDLDDSKKELVTNIIKKCHPHMYDDLLQKTEFCGINKIKQFSLDKKSRLIFIIISNINNDKIFVPLLFDLNHCIYIKKEKNYDNNKNEQTFEWCFKKHQEEIKNNLIKFYKKRISEEQFESEIKKIFLKFK